MATQTYVNAVTLSDAAEWNKWDTAAYVALTGVAGTNTITATGPANLTSVATNPPLWFIPAVTNTGATTINITPSGGAALGAKNVFSNGAACVGGELFINVPVLIVYDGTQFNIIGGSGVSPTMANVSKTIYGLTYANNVADATNDLDIAAGGAIDSTGVDTITVAAITKQSDVAWAVGSGNGGLDTGAVGNSNYYIHAIKRVDTKVTDILFSLSATAPTMPANYTLRRLIGFFQRSAGAILAFHTYETEGGGIEQTWDTPTLDVNLANTLTTSRRTDAVRVPLNFSVTAIMRIGINDAGTAAAVFSCPDEADAAPSLTAAPLASLWQQVAGVEVLGTFQIRTSAAGLIAARSSVATTDLYVAVTIGFRWARRN